MIGFLQPVFDIFFKLPEKIRFVLVGGYNTVFAMVLYAILYDALSEQLDYLVILIISHFISVANSFLALKWFVFRTCGHYWAEFIKCNFVYLGTLLLNIALLYLAVNILHITPVISQVLILVTIAVVSYIGHKLFSFKR